jgi:hypothetical protein
VQVQRRQLLLLTSLACNAFLDVEGFPTTGYVEPWIYGDQEATYGYLCSALGVSQPI